MRKVCFSHYWLICVFLTHALLTVVTPVLGQSETVDPTKSDYYVKRGVALMDKGQMSEAIADFTAALELKPGSITALSQRAKAFFFTGQALKSMDDLNRAIRQAPSIADLYKLRADILSTSGDFENAIKDYNKAISLSPHAATAYNNRAVALANLNKAKEAMEDLNTAMELSITKPSSPAPSVFPGAQW